MINLKNKYKENYFIGKIIKVYYVVILKTKKRKKKASNFLGLCISYKKNRINLVNVVKKEKIYFNFDYTSPIIYKILVIKSYRRAFFRVSKLYFKSNNYYYDSFNDNLVSNLDSFKFDFFFASFIKKKLAKKRNKIKKFKRKYMKTENWRNLKDELDELDELDDE